MSLPSNGSLSAIVVEVVSEKTGYPVEVLDLDMQLDADLGIDSIKRVEILSALQERLPTLPSIRPELLGTFRSLRAIVEHINGPETLAHHAVPEPASTAPAPGSDPLAEIARVLVETVAEKTGYPADMLELDMRLDADLGIDSIKRVEIFSAIQERMPGARAAGPDEIGTLGTLREIVAFLGRSAQGQPEPEACAAASTPAAPAGDPIARVLLESVAEKTGYPIEMLELDMQLDVDLGIDSIKRVEILSAVQERLPAAQAIGPEQLGTLRTLRQIAEFLSGSPAVGPQREVVGVEGFAHRANPGGAETGEIRQPAALAVNGSAAPRITNTPMAWWPRAGCPDQALPAGSLRIRGCRIVAMRFRFERAEWSGSPTMAHRWPGRSSAG